MDSISLIVMFYLYAGLMFSSVSESHSLFPGTGCLTQVFLWPALLFIYAVKAVRDSDFGWFVRYGTLRASNLIGCGGIRKEPVGPKVVIEKELCDPVSVNGIATIPGPFYHIYSIDEDGVKVLVDTVDGDIREAARTAERKLDMMVMEIAFRENPYGLYSSLPIIETGGTPSENK